MVRRFYEDLQRQTRRDHARAGTSSSRRPDPRAPGDDDCGHAARKHKPTFTPHEDTGDFVIVVNADKIRLTGNKLDQKFYYRHSGIPGGFGRSYRDHLGAARPTRSRRPCRGMLPKNRLARQMLTKLKVYATPDHPHAAQNPASP